MKIGNAIRHVGQHLPGISSCALFLAFIQHLLLHPWSDGRSYCALYKAKAVVQQGAHLVCAASICLWRHWVGCIAVPICTSSMENIIDEIYHAVCCRAQHRRNCINLRV